MAKQSLEVLQRFNVTEPWPTPLQMLRPLKAFEFWFGGLFGLGFIWFGVCLVWGVGFRVWGLVQVSVAGMLCIGTHSWA